MSIRIYQDENATVSQFGRKNKRDEPKIAKHSIPKPNKRVALGNITNQAHGCRVQPSRAAKEKHKVHAAKTSENVDNLIDLPKPVISNTSLATLKESPMVLSLTPFASDSFEDITAGDIKANDIDINLDPSFASEYAYDIHKYLKKAEQKYCPRSNYMRKQADINVSMRSILIDWLVEVAEEYKLTPQTLYLTVNYIDRFLSCMSVLRGKLQLVGTACMLVAAKFEEIYPPEVAEFVYITDDTYTSKQVLRMESLVLKTLSFELSVPTAREFLSRYLQAAGVSKESQLAYLSQYLTDLTLIDYEVYLRYSASMIAASAVLVSNVTLKREVWNTTMEHYSGYSICELKDCGRDIYRLFQLAPKSQQKSVQSKYEVPKYGCVSKLTPPDRLPL